MNLPTTIEYPLFAIGDLHGQLDWLDTLLAKLRAHPEWPRARLVFLGDLVDRGPKIRALVDRVLELLEEKSGSTAVMGNHDLGLVKAAGLDGEPVASWVKRYADNYDHTNTFLSYLGKEPQYRSFHDWVKDLEQLREGMPERHRTLLANLPWIVEAEGHVFLHNGLSPELDCPASVQLHCLRTKRWERSIVSPRFGTDTDRLFNPDYPVWLGADKRLSDRPLPLPNRVQVSGHILVSTPDANAVRIRIDTSGGTREPLTACLLRGPGATPEFIFSDR